MILSAMALKGGAAVLASPYFVGVVSSLGGILAGGLFGAGEFEPIKAKPIVKTMDTDLFNRSDLPGNDGWDSAREWCSFDFKQFLTEQIVAWYERTGFSPDFEADILEGSGYKDYFSIPAVNNDPATYDAANLDALREEILEFTRGNPNAVAGDLTSWVKRVDALLAEKFEGYLTDVQLDAAIYRAGSYLSYLRSLNDCAQHLAGSIDYIQDYVNVAIAEITSHCGDWEVWKYSDEKVRVSEVKSNWTKNIYPALKDLADTFDRGTFKLRLDYMLAHVQKLNDAKISKFKMISNTFDGMKTSVLYENFKLEIDSLHKTYAETIKKNNEEHTKQLKELQEAHETAMSAMKASYEKIIGELQKTLTRYKVALNKSENLLKKYATDLDKYSQKEIDRLVNERIALSSSGNNLLEQSNELALKTFTVDPSLYNGKTTAEMNKQIAEISTAGVNKTKADILAAQKIEKENKATTMSYVKMGFAGALALAGTAAAVAFNRSGKVSSNNINYNNNNNNGGNGDNNNNNVNGNQLPPPANSSS